MPRQVWVIHGGTTFETYEEYRAYLRGKEVDLEYLLAWDWKTSLQEALGEGFQVITPRMPNANNARYTEWKLWFEKLAPLMTDGVILIGHSLGGTFLAQYLTEESLPVQVKAAFLIAPPYDTGGSGEWLGDFALPSDLSRLAARGGTITLYHSQDDPVVPFAQLAKYQQALPQAQARIFNDREHFNQATLPELVEDIQKLS